MRCIQHLYRSWCTHRGGALAAELLLFSLLSLLPLLLSLAALLGSLDSFVGAARADALEAAVRVRLVESLGASDQVLDLVDQAFGPSSGTVVTVGLLFALYAANRGFISLVGSLDVVFATRSARGWVSQRLTGLTLGLGSILLLPVAVVAGYAGRFVAGRVTDDPLAQHLVDWVMTGFGLVVAVCWVATLYHLAPGERGRWRDHVVGAVVCVAAAVFVTELVRRWLGTFGTNPLYGAIGATIGLVWWAYFLCCTFFLGAEVTVWRRGRRVAS